ncbi:DNA ligase [Streptomyces kunmingensis]|uniref:DNA ligase n=1 Tax=Streptomyces kunmingensis TaxID=68225 RepID=A0ABU6CK81_9ACTN|nr:DNA ligase [Streptomyces kunmingensis]MEB3965022.1 DNA ligase [Streptomyces kunmingensis]
MEFPLAVALAESVSTLPTGPGWWYEPKFDGHRLVMHRTEETVKCQARSGRTVTAAWMDLVGAAQSVLRPGTVLDGEAVVWVGGRLDFAAAEARGNATPRRASALAAEYPAHYAVWDCLALDGVDLRGRPYVERRAALLEVLADAKPSIRPVPATEEAEVARVWFERLQAQGVEGVVAKRAASPYGSARVWRMARHSATVEAEVVGCVGPPVQPQRVAVRLPDGRCVLSQPVIAPVAAELARHITQAGPGRRARTDDGEAYTTTGSGLTVEVVASTARHATVTVTRVR